MSDKDILRSFAESRTDDEEFLMTIAEQVREACAQIVASRLYKADPEFLERRGDEERIPYETGQRLAESILSEIRALDLSQIEPKEDVQADCPVEYVELNMLNYDEDQVSQLNEWAIWSYGKIESLSAQLSESNANRDSWRRTAERLQNERLKLKQRAEQAKQDAAFYRSCALSGEVPKEGAEPSAVKAIDEAMKCEHGKSMTDYCEPCGRIHSNG